jgi:hypothetical protein
VIRIETTAEFDSQGRFIASGQSPSAVAPGPHRIVVLVEEPAAQQMAPQLSEAPTTSPLERVGGVLVFTGQLLEDPETVRQRLDEERLRFLLGESSQ